MKKAKISKTVKKEKINDATELYSIKNLLLIILIIVLVFSIFYFITTLVVKSSKQDIPTRNNITEIDCTKITLNHLLDRKDQEYYVLVTKESLYNNLGLKTNYIEIYDKYINDYSKKDESLKFYKVDLDDALNKNYIGNSTNISENLEELKLNDEVLFKISDGKIEKYYIGNEDIIKTLSSL